MKKKNNKKIFNKKMSFTLLLGIAASFSPLLVMGSCNGGDGGFAKKEANAELTKLSEQLSKITKTTKVKPVFSDYEFKNKEMTIIDFASAFGLDISRIAEYNKLKLIVNKDKDSSVIKIKLKYLGNETDSQLTIKSFTDIEDYFNSLKEQLSKLTMVLEGKEQFLEKAFDKEPMNQETLANNFKFFLPDNFLDKDVELKVTKNKGETKVYYYLYIPKNSTSINVDVKSFIKDFQDIKWAPKSPNFISHQVNFKDSFISHQEGYFVTQDNQGNYLLDKKISKSQRAWIYLMRNIMSYNSKNNQFRLEHGNNVWDYSGFADNITFLNEADDITDWAWRDKPSDVQDKCYATGYGRDYFIRARTEYNNIFFREFPSILASKPNFGLSTLGWYSSLFLVAHLDPTADDDEKSITKHVWQNAGNIFLMPGHKDSKLFTKDNIHFPSKDQIKEQNIYLTTARAIDVDDSKIIFVSNSGMISATDYDLNVLPNIEVQNLLDDNEKNRYYEVARANLDSVINYKYERISDYNSIDFISSTFKSLGDKGYTFMYWKNHNALSDEKDFIGLKDIYPDQKELYQVTLDKNFKILENKKLELPAIVLTYEDYKKKKQALNTDELVGEIKDKNFADGYAKVNKTYNDASNLSASDVTNYFKTSEVEINGKKYFYLADEKMTKILVLDNDYQVEKTIDIPMDAFKKLEDADGHQRYITKMFKKDNNLILFSNYLETLVIDTEGNIVKEPTANYSSYLEKYRNTIFQNPYKNTEIFQIDENKYLAFMHRINKDADTNHRIIKITAIVDANGQFEQEK